MAIDPETLTGNRLYDALMRHMRTADGCLCGHYTFWEREHIEHQARAIAREMHSA